MSPATEPDDDVEIERSLAVMVAVFVVMEFESDPAALLGEENEPAAVAKCFLRSVSCQDGRSMTFQFNSFSSCSMEQESFFIGHVSLLQLIIPLFL